MARGGDLALCAGRPGAQRKSDNSALSSDDGTRPHAPRGAARSAEESDRWHRADEYRFRTLAGDEPAREAAFTAYRQDVAGPALVRINHNSETTRMQEQK